MEGYLRFLEIKRKSRHPCVVFDLINNKIHYVQFGERSYQTYKQFLNYIIKAPNAV